MSKRLTNKEFLDKIPTHIKTKFKFLNEYKSSMDFILLEDELGIVYSQRPHWIISGRNPGIESAINKTDAISRIVLNNFNGELLVISEYISHESNIVVEDRFGVKYNTTPSNLKSSKYPRFSSAINPNVAFKIHGKNTHGQLYDYSLVDASSSKGNTSIICHKHGVFSKSYNSHVINKQGCPKCSLINASKLTSSTLDEFIQKARIKHSNKYDYSNSIYTSSNSKIEVLCKIHGPFFPAANNHLQGSGCPVCGRENSGGLGYNKSLWVEKFNKSKKDKKCIVYILHAYNKNEEFVKIGRTFTGVNSRFGSGSKARMPYNYNVIKEIPGPPDYIYDLENKLHSEYKKFRYIPNNQFKGFTECFSIDALNYLKDEKY